MFFNSPTHTIQEAAQLQRQQLRANVATFDAALLALKNGNDQILPPIAAAQQVGNSYIYIYIPRGVQSPKVREKASPPKHIVLRYHYVSFLKGAWNSRVFCFVYQ